MQSLSVLELLSATVAHIGGTFLAAALAMLIAASRTRRIGIILGGIGLFGGVMNAMMLPGQPTWLMMIDVALYVPAGWLAAEVVLRVKDRESRNAWHELSHFGRGPGKRQHRHDVQFRATFGHEGPGRTACSHTSKHTGVARPLRDEVLITMPSSKKEALATLVPKRPTKCCS